MVYIRELSTESEVPPFPYGLSLSRHDLHEQVDAMRISEKPPVSSEGNSEGSLVPSRSNAFPEFMGTPLVTSDGLCTVPFVSSCLSWSLNVPWLAKENPSNWLERRISSSDARQHLNHVFSPLVDYLVYRNRNLVDFVDSPGQSALVRVKDEVMNITYGSVNRVDAIGNGSGPLVSTVCASHVMSLFVDKLMWAYDLKNNGKGLTVLCLDDAVDNSAPVELYRPNTLDVKKAEKLKALKNWHDKFESDWKSVVVDFISAWNAEQKRQLATMRARNPTDQAVGSSTSALSTSTSKEIALQDTKSFLSEVYMSTEKQYHIQKVSKAISRIHDAVLALSSFRLFDFKKCGANDRNGLGGFSFHEALLYVMSFQTLVYKSDNNRILILQFVVGQRHVKIDSKLSFSQTSIRGSCSWTDLSSRWRTNQREEQKRLVYGTIDPSKRARSERNVVG